jgi:hypothetical protein
MSEFTKSLRSLCVALGLGVGLYACNKPADLPTLPPAVVAAATPAAPGVPAVSAPVAASVASTPAPARASATIDRARAAQSSAEQAAYASAYKNAAVANKLLGAHTYRVAATDKET